jgi:hypothetical protein
MRPAPDRAPAAAAFTGECAFGEEVVSVIAVTSREVIRTQRLESGRSRRREMTVEPDGIDADELGVEATVGCTATGAFRTAQSRPLFVCGERPARRACGHPKKGVRAACGYAQWGASRSVRIRPETSGRGLTLAPARGRWATCGGACGERRVGAREPARGDGFSVCGAPPAACSRAEQSEASRLRERLKRAASQ